MNNNNIYLTDNLYEARKEVSNRINKLSKIDDFELSVEYLKAIHKYLFHDYLVSSGEFRDYNLRKSETIINDHSVKYTDYHKIEENLRYDFEEEKHINYHILSKEKQVKRLADLTIRIWSTHPFIEGNTRTTSIFMQKYLKYLGFNPNDEYFKENSKYFRNALVKASYYNQIYKVIPDNKPLIKFYQKLLYDSTIELKISDLIVKEMFTIPKDVEQAKTKIKNKEKKV